MPIPCDFYFFSCGVQHEIKNRRTSNSSFVVEYCFSHSMCFVFPYEVEKCPLKVHKKMYWNFDDACIDPLDWFCNGGYGVSTRHLISRRCLAYISIDARYTYDSN